MTIKDFERMDALAVLSRQLPPNGRHGQWSWEWRSLQDGRDGQEPLVTVWRNRTRIANLFGADAMEMLTRLIATEPSHDA
jgi:hypothetical protein